MVRPERYVANLSTRRLGHHLTCRFVSGEAPFIESVEGICLGSCVGLSAPDASPDPDRQLYLATMVGSRRAVRELLEAGAKPDAFVRCSHAHGTERPGPLHVAAATGATEIVEMLLQAGADPQMPTRHRRHPAAAEQPEDSITCPLNEAERLALLGADETFEISRAYMQRGYHAAYGYRGRPRPLKAAATWRMSEGGPLSATVLSWSSTLELSTMRPGATYYSKRANSSWNEPSDFATFVLRPTYFWLPLRELCHLLGSHSEDLLLERRGAMQRMHLSPAGEQLVLQPRGLCLHLRSDRLLVDHFRRGAPL